MDTSQFVMSDKDRINLKQLIAENGTVDYTNHIRSLKHSVPLFKELAALMRIMQDYEDTDKITELAIVQCPVLYSAYPDMYVKLIKKQFKFPMALKFVQVLKRIEDGTVSHHEASYEVGMVLRKMYVDSAIQGTPASSTNTSLPQADTSLPQGRPALNTSWKDWKINQGK